MMPTKSPRFLLLLGLAFLLMVSAAPGSAQEAEPAQDRVVFSRTYMAKHLNLHEVELLVVEQCAAATEQCLLVSSSMGESFASVSVQAENAVHQAIVRELAARDVVPPTQAFQVTLVAASLESGAELGPLPPAAVEALKDVQQLLPYKSYWLVDTAWARTADEVAVYLTGPDGHPLRVTIDFQSRSMDQIFVRTFDLYRPGGAEVAGIEGADRESSPRRLLRTSFSMAVGETLVVGTSKLNGGSQALLALITAIP